MADVTGHPRNVRIVEGRNADLVIGSEQFPFRGDAATSESSAWAKEGRSREQNRARQAYGLSMAFFLLV